MYKIIDKKLLAPGIYSMDIVAPRVSKAALPGQFLIIIVDDEGERIPLTICDSNREKGTVTIVTQTTGASTKELNHKEIGDSVKELVGPLGKPSQFIYEDIEKLKEEKILFVGGGAGVAPIYPQVKWLKERGVDFHLVIGFKNKEFIIMEDEFRKLTDNLLLATDDGSYGFHGMVTHAIEELVKNRGEHYNRCIVIGPMIMMKFVALLTKELNISTIVSLNPLMVDGTGMCGACRVTVGEETKFACVDGPEFDGHLVDFDEALRRQAQYKEEEIEIEHDHENCELTKGMR